MRRLLWYFGLVDLVWVWFALDKQPRPSLRIVWCDEHEQKYAYHNGMARLLPNGGCVGVYWSHLSYCRWRMYKPFQKPRPVSEMSRPKKPHYRICKHGAASEL